VNQTAIADSS